MSSKGSSKIRTIFPRVVPSFQVPVFEVVASNVKVPESIMLYTDIPPTVTVQSSSILLIIVKFRADNAGLKLSPVLPPFSYTLTPIDEEYIRSNWSSELSGTV